jgi:uncharacterized membrane protein YphA (DoxX/SURF4 family)
MLGLKTRTAALAALMCMTVLLAFLFRRGLKAGSFVDHIPELAWREADETDLF